MRGEGMKDVGEGEDQEPSRASMASRTPATLWLLRLSATTMWPGARVGPRTERIYSKKASPHVLAFLLAGAQRFF